MSIEGSRALARLREFLAKLGDTRGRRPVNLLMFQPLRDIEVRVTVDLIEPHMTSSHEFVEPAIDQVRSFLVVGVKTAREQSRGCASPP